MWSQYALNCQIISLILMMLLRLIDKDWECSLLMICACISRRVWTDSDKENTIVAMSIDDVNSFMWWLMMRSCSIETLMILTDVTTLTSNTCQFRRKMRWAHSLTFCFLFLLRHAEYFVENMKSRSTSKFALNAFWSLRRIFALKLVTADLYSCESICSYAHDHFIINKAQ